MKKEYRRPALSVLGTVAEHTLATSCIIKSPGGTDSQFADEQAGTYQGSLPTC